MLPTPKLNHRQKISAARGLATRRLPYFSSALFTLILKPLPGMFKMVGAAMGVNAKAVLYYDPDVVENDWDIEDIEFGLLHEVGHLLRDHASKCKKESYKAKQWNLAGDAAINDDLVEAGLKPLSTDMVPSNIKHPKTDLPMKTGLVEEAYYHAIRQMKEDPGGGSPRPGSGNCGGISGNPMEGLPGDGEGEGEGEGRSNVEIERVRKDCAKEVQKASAKSRGSVPAGYMVWADQIIAPPKIRWQDKVQRTVRHGVSKVRGSVDYHYGQISRRQWGIGFGPGMPILPSMFAPMPRIACFVDTSGSMGDDDLAEAMAEVNGVVKASGAEVLLGCCDAEVHGNIEVVTNLKAACAKLEGGGGTDFNPVFREIERMPPASRPHIAIMMTDGGGPAPVVAPRGLIVIWVLIGHHAIVPYSGEWGGPSITWGEQIFVTRDDPH